ncbi:hypothetical protein AVEN_124314-1 [Araneus ventricosus]|uniref:Uncharacterized protein n=1 Tax=Araneus ventricosus TaxID=182803 RepID=A0A4Y2MYG3_ARAVE|nr:hypothetical protein AVEN_124314-1 [Araneus ventricosus]
MCTREKNIRITQEHPGLPRKAFNSTIREVSYGPFFLKSQRMLLVCITCAERPVNVTSIEPRWIGRTGNSQETTGTLETCPVVASTTLCPHEGIRVFLYSVLIECIEHPSYSSNLARNILAPYKKPIQQETDLRSPSIPINRSDHHRGDSNSPPKIHKSSSQPLSHLPLSKTFYSSFTYADSTPITISASIDRRMAHLDSGNLNNIFNFERQMHDW